MFAGLGDYQLNAFYAKPIVADGTSVKRGDVIAKHQGLHCGCYGDSMTDHVHFQLTRGGETIDSTSYAFCAFRYTRTCLMSFCYSLL